MAHVTIPAVEPLVTYDVGGSPQSVFTIPFAFFSTSDITVTIDGTQQLVADYTVTGTAVDRGYSGGTVTLDTAVSNVEVMIRRIITIERTTDFPTSGPLQIDSLNTQLDRLIAICQQINTEFGSVLRVPAGEILTVLPPAAARAGLLAGFNSVGDLIAVSLIAGSVVVSAAMIPVVQAASLAAARNLLGFGSAQTLMFVGSVGAPGLAVNDGVGTTGLYSTGTNNLDIAAGGTRVFNFNSTGATAYDNFKMFRLTGAPTVQQSSLFRWHMVSGTTDNAKSLGGGYRIDNNTAGAGDFSTSFPVEYFVQNYSQAFDAGFFWNPSNIPLGDDATKVWYGTNFTLVSTHSLSQDRASAIVSTFTAGKVRGVTVTAPPPYAYTAGQTGIQVKVFYGSGYAEHGTAYASADVSGVLTSPTSWTRNANGTGGTPFDGVDAGLVQEAGSLNPGGNFSASPSILIQPPAPSGASPYTFGIDGGPTFVLARTLGANIIAGNGSVVGPLQFAISDATSGWVPAQIYAIVTDPAAPTSQGQLVFGTPATKTSGVNDRMRLGLGLMGSRLDGNTFTDKGIGTTDWSAYWLSDPVTPFATKGFLDYGTGYVRLLSGANVPMVLGVSNTAMMYFMSPSGSYGTSDLAVEVYMGDNGATAGPLLNLYRDSASPAVSDVLGLAGFFGRDSAAAKIRYGFIDVVIASPTSTTTSMSMNFGGQFSGTDYNMLTIERRNVLIGSAALATNATDGFLYLTTCPGPPTGVPTAYSGRAAVIYDSTNNRLRVYNGGWQTPSDSIRTRAATPIIYVSVTGNDANNGLTAGTPVQTLQHAVDLATTSFDTSISAWTWGTNIGRRPGVTVQLATATVGASYEIAVPVFLDGLSVAGPITILGDKANSTAYNINVINAYQGFTAQHGGMLRVHGVSIRGQVNTTLVNALDNGNIEVDTVHFASGTGICNFVGAANQSSVSIVGPIYLDGTTVGAVFEAIDLSKITCLGTINIGAALTMSAGFIIMDGLSQFLTEGNPLVTAGAGVAGTTGFPYVLTQDSMLRCDPSNIPGSAGQGIAHAGSWINGSTFNAAFSAILPANQTGIADSTFTKINFTTVSWQQQATYNNEWLPQKGTAFISASAVWSNAVDGDFATIAIYKNGAALKQRTFSCKTANSDTLSIDVIDKPTGSDLYDCRVQLVHGSGTHTISAVAAQTYFQGAMIW